MNRIEQENYSIVRALFVPLEEFQPMCRAVLDGVWRGEVWTDDSENPLSAMLMTFLSGGGPAWCFLAGKPDNAEFNAALNRGIFEERWAGKDVGDFLFTCSPEDWGGALGTVGNPRQPAPMLRQHHICRELTDDGRSNLPQGYTIHPMTTDLLKREEVELPSQVKTTLGKWRSMKDERFQDFGFVVLYENRVISWATVDFVGSGSGDLGFETLPEFGKRGLGSAVAAAALEHGREMGIRIHWTCAADNTGSQRTAQKLGLEREQDYTMYLFALDLADHLAQLAYSFLARGEHRAAIDCYEQLFAQKADIPSWAYFDTAQAWAALDDGDNAVRYLRLAAKSGWSAVEITEQTPEFQLLHDTPEWVEVIERMRNRGK